jgi:hypothetical protein
VAVLVAALVLDVQEVAAVLTSSDRAGGVGRHRPGGVEQLAVRFTQMFTYPQAAMAVSSARTGRKNEVVASGSDLLAGPF